MTVCSAAHRSDTARHTARSAAPSSGRLVRERHTLVMTSADQALSSNGRVQPGGLRLGAAGASAAGGWLGCPVAGGGAASGHSAATPGMVHGSPR
ncbi:hypothetical protein GCM10023321_81070 [Pseudonocardia eucalypti]|uniref:Uncharacterized protein n=1 Tax=Pseudonocardia eucalypti TaxID=648755 RepID=A0ABP9REL1_9PSEU